MQFYHSIIVFEKVEASKPDSHCFFTSINSKLQCSFCFLLCNFTIVNSKYPYKAQEDTEYHCITVCKQFKRQKWLKEKIKIQSQREYFRDLFESNQKETKCLTGNPRRHCGWLTQHTSKGIASKHWMCIFERLPNQFKQLVVQLYLALWPNMAYSLLHTPFQNPIKTKHMKRETPRDWYRDINKHIINVQLHAF